MSLRTAEMIVSSDSQIEGTQPRTNVTGTMCDFCAECGDSVGEDDHLLLYEQARWHPSSVCHQPRRIHNGTSSKSSLLGRGEQWAMSTDRRLHFSFPNSGIRGGDNQWKCPICFMSTPEHTIEDNHFFLSSLHPSSILPIMLAHCHPLAVSAGKLSGRAQTARGEEMHLHLHVSHHFCANLHLVLQTISGLLLKTPKKKW